MLDRTVELPETAASGVVKLWEGRAERHRSRAGVWPSWQSHWALVHAIGSEGHRKDQQPPVLLSWWPRGTEGVESTTRARGEAKEPEMVGINQNLNRSLNFCKLNNLSFFLENYF